VFRLGVQFWGEFFLWGWVVTMSIVGYRFYNGCVPWRSLFLVGGVNLGGCCPQVCFLGCLFRVFRLYTAPFVCMLSFTDLCSSWAGIWLFNKICCFKKKNYMCLSIKWCPIDLFNQKTKTTLFVPFYRSDLQKLPWYGYWEKLFE